jgi:hypothetical protein
MAILENGPYALNTDSVRAVQIRPIRHRGEGKLRTEYFADPIGISIKFPSTRAMARPPGVLVLGDRQAGELVPPAQTRLPWDDMPVVLEPVYGGLRMTERFRVLALTRERARLFPTGQIVASYKWVENDVRLAGAGIVLPDDTLDALDALIP